MTTIKLTDEQWIKVRTFLRNERNAYVGSDEQECRRFVEGVLWMSRSGAQWHLLPAEYGKWNSVYKRFGRWCDQGVWERMLAHFGQDPDMEKTGWWTAPLCGHMPVPLEPQKKRRTNRSSAGSQSGRV